MQKLKDISHYTDVATTRSDYFYMFRSANFFLVRNVGLPNTKLDAVKTSRFCSMNKPRYINNQRAAHKRYILLNLAIHSQQIKLVLNMCNAFIIHSIQCLLVSSTGVWGQHSSEDEITFCWHTSQWCQPSPNLRSWGDGK